MNITYYKSKARFSINSVPVILCYKYKHKKSCYRISRREWKNFFGRMPFNDLKSLLDHIVICFQKVYLVVYKLSTSSHFFFSFIESKELATICFQKDSLCSFRINTISQFPWRIPEKASPRLSKIHTANYTSYSFTSWHFIWYMQNGLENGTIVHFHLP